MNKGLVVKISGDVADIKNKIESVSSGLRQLGADGNKSGGSISEGMTKAKGGIRSISEQLALAKQQFVLFWGAAELKQGVVALASTADQIQGVDARLRLATGSQFAFTRAQSEAYAIANTTGQSYADVAALQSRLSMNTDKSAESLDKMAMVTAATSRALLISGASTAEASSVTRQLSQALASGVLRGEEFNAMSENGARLQKALADGLGVPVGKLRELATQGVLTTEVVTKALESQSEALAREAASMPRLMGQAAAHLSNEFGRIVNDANNVTGAGAVVASSIDYVANHMEIVLGGAVVASSALLARGAVAVAMWGAQAVASQGAATASTIALRHAAVTEAEAEVAAMETRRASAKYYWDQVAAEQALAASRARLTAATTALSEAQSGASTISRGLSAVVDALGGPIGIVTMLLTAGATAWAIWGREAETAGSKAKTAAEKGEEAFERLRKARQFGQDELAPLRENVAAAEAALTEARQKQSEADDVLKKAQEAARAGGRVAQSIALPMVSKNAVAEAEANLNKAKSQLSQAEGWATNVGGAGAQTGKMLKDAFTGEYLDQYRKKLDPLKAALDDMRKKAEAAGIAIGSPEYRDAEALIRKSFEKKGSKSSAGPSLDLDNYGKSALAEIQAESSRKMDLLKANLASEMAVVQRGYDAGTTSLEAYYAERRRVIETESQAEIQQQQQAITQAQAEIARLQQLKPQGARGSEQISDQTRAMDEKIKDAQAKIDVLKVQTTAAVADISADQAKAARERINTALADAQAVISATEQSLESRVITGLETESTARAKLKDMIQEQGQALERDLVPQIERMMLVASNPKARAELQAMLDKIREMATEAKTQTWADGLKQGVQDYATEASDAFQTARDAATSAFSSMEDALVEFTTTGKLSVSDMVTSMLADIARLAIRQSITQPLATGLTSVIGSLLGGTAFNVGSGAALGSSTGTGGGFNMGGGAVTGLATGGRITGPGTGTSDDVPMWGSNGEFVIREASARKLGYAQLEWINANGELPERHATGGIIGQRKSSPDTARRGDRRSPITGILPIDRTVDRSTLERMLNSSVIEREHTMDRSTIERTWLPSISNFSNTVQSSPVAFDASGFRPFALGGVFGEAGPEAVMPLTRTSDGRLGVASTGGATQPQAMNVRVEMVNQGTPQQVQSVTPKFDAEGMVLKIITADLARNGPVARTMAGAYNLKRTV